MQFECNESGFVRVKVPVPQVEREQGVTRLRLNFWLPNDPIDLSPHTHSAYFESFVVDGGYAHSIYEVSDEGDEYIDFKKNKERKAFEGGRVKLKHKNDEDTHSGQIIAFDKSIIHRIKDRKDYSLTLNAVFRDAVVDNWYHVYGGGGVELDDISKHRAIVDASLRVSLAADIIAKLISL